MVLDIRPCTEGDDTCPMMDCWLPSTEEVRRDASELDVLEFGRVIFRTDFVREETTGGTPATVLNILAATHSLPAEAPWATG